jgi:hypothetical protein
MNLISLLFQTLFICNIIIISWEGEDINGFLEKHGCIKWFALNALFYGGRKWFRGLRAHTWLQDQALVTKCFPNKSLGL